MSQKRVSKSKKPTRKKTPSKTQTIKRAKPMNAVTKSLYERLQKKKLFKSLMKYQVAGYVKGRITKKYLIDRIQNTVLMSDALRSGSPVFYEIQWTRLADKLISQFKREKSKWEIRY